MVRTSGPDLVVFDGYRGIHDGDRTAATGLEALLGCEDSTYWNNWSEHGDSLKRRFDRASAWLEVRLGDITHVNIIGFSMGCQLAVRFVHHASIRAPSIEYSQLLLIAPDPKYRPVGRDAEEIQAGTSSAFEEAGALWGGRGLAGPRFVSGLADVANRMERIRIVYCRSDGVAEWSANVELMVDELLATTGIELIEAIDGEVVSTDDMTVDLGVGNPEVDVHDRLWESVIFV
ncbi:MAG: hypothetical protein HN575_05225 [Actinobacteria bacterium]|nr:hypothetical protein [Actinomycetota bacterium]MBT4278273.1 hypothetical protein [Actinomycetota bacterium]MBT7607117.1 hypothetical protein [Actinomycetota bacterium]MBT7661532.1 hypothetical protein [Actinomycetota bacterium]